MKRVHFTLIAASLLTAIMLNVRCNPTNRYDIKGTWIFTIEYSGAYFDKTLTFRGDMIQGTVTDKLDGIAAYAFDGYSVNFDLSAICFCQKIWKGHFVDKDYLEGTLSGCSSGTWTASRI